MPNDAAARARAGLRPGAHLRRRRAGGRALPRARAPAAACRSTTRSIPTRTIRCAPRAALRVPTSRSSATGCPTARSACEEFFFGAVGAAAATGASCSAATAGRTALGAPTCATSVTSRPAEHNALNCSALAVLNVSRESMARNGFSPATRVFEAAGAGACLITDAWEGIEEFLEPGDEVLVARRRRRGRRAPRRARPERARRDRRGRARARARRAHLCAAGRAGGGESSTVALAVSAVKVVIARAVDHLLVGQRPRHQLPGAGRASSRRAATTCSSASATCPWYAAHRDLPAPPWGRTVPLRRPRRSCGGASAGVVAAPTS